MGNPADTAFLRCCLSG